MKVCVLIPALNEARTIGKIVQAVRGQNLDVVVIDDGSSDRTGEIAKENGAKVIRHEMKKGKGASLRDGFNDVLQNDYGGVIILDGDGQHDVDEIKKFLQEAKLYPKTVVVGNRMQDIQKMPFLRVLTNKIMSGLISLTCGVSIPDSQCGYRYIPTEVLRQIHLTCDDYEIETEILIKVRKQGFSVRSIPIKTIYAQETSYIHPVKDTLRFISYYLRETFSSPKQRNIS